MEALYPATGARSRSRSGRGSGSAKWRALAAFIAVPVLLPVLVILGSVFVPEGETWTHLLNNVLGEVLLNTLWLVLGVACITALLGTSLAWLTAVTEFPGRSVFSWALMLPIAVPGYVMAFVVIGLLDYAGPLQSMLRDYFGAGAVLPSVRGRAGVIAVMSLVLYPYVFLIARNAFLTQGARALEAGQSLGLSRRQGFFRIALPMARPWIAGGVMLVVMETLADFGTVSVFNYNTFTTAIYEAWFSLFSVKAALQLSSVLMLLVLGTVVIERSLRADAHYTGRGAQNAPRISLKGWIRWAATCFAGAVLLLAFVLPVTQMLIWGWQNFSADFDARYVAFVSHSLLLAIIAALLITTVALLLAYSLRNAPGRFSSMCARLATLGYALPGTVLAVGIFVPLAGLSSVVQGGLDLLFGDGAPTVLLQATLLTMLLAYLVRFLAVAYTPVDSNMQRVTHSVDEASRSLGVSGGRMLKRVHFPMLRGGLLTAMTLVFVDVMKEMPITLMTRPFGWDTLAVRVFELTSEGHWERAALPALAIVLVGLVPIMIMVRRTERAS